MKIYISSIGFVFEHQVLKLLSHERNPLTIRTTILIGNLSKFKLISTRIYHWHCRKK